MKIKLWCIVLMVVFPAAASAGVIFQDSFETTTAGALPTGWTLAYPGVSNYVTYSDASDGAASFYSKGHPYSGTSLETTISGSVSSPVTVSYDMKITDWPGADGQALANFGFGGTGTYFGITKVDGSYKFVFGADTRHEIPIPANLPGWDVTAWNEYSAIIDIANRTAKYYVDGSLVLSATGLRDYAYQGVRINSGNAGEGGGYPAAYYDNFYVCDGTDPSCGSTDEGTTPGTQAATLGELVSLAWNAYGGECGDVGCSIPQGFTQIAARNFNDYRDVVYKRGNNIVIAFKGTNPIVGPNGAADVAFWTGELTPSLKNYIHAAADLLIATHAQYPEAFIQLTGHSMGGGIAQLLGKASGYTTNTFNSAGGALLYPQLSDELKPVYGTAEKDFGIRNYRIYGDAVSSATMQIGKVTTARKASLSICDAALPLCDLHAHNIATVYEAFGNAVPAPGWILLDGFPDKVADGTIPIIQAVGVVVGASVAVVKKKFNAAVAGGNPFFFDPPPADAYIFDAGAGPLFAAIGLPARGDGQQYSIYLRKGDQWVLTDKAEYSWFSFDIPLQSFAVGNWPDPGPDTNGVVFGLKFASSGTFDGTVTPTRLASSQPGAWVPIEGDIRLADGTPLCAMVLANGEYMFSCDGTGHYDLSVPVDGNGQITLFAFADGFAPFRVVLGPEGFPRSVEMQTAAPDSPHIVVTRDVACSDKPNWVHITGNVQSSSGQPLCAMVLSNGQQLFSCDTNLGKYDLTVPVDSNGQVTAFSFADGFQPYRATFEAPSCDGAGRSNLFIGTTWTGTQEVDAGGESCTWDLIATFDTDKSGTLRTTLRNDNSPSVNCISGSGGFKYSILGTELIVSSAEPMHCDVPQLCLDNFAIDTGVDLSQTLPTKIEVNESFPYQGVTVYRNTVLVRQ